MQVNETQKTIIIPKVKRYFNQDLKGKHFALWGLAFKPDTDDIREAPALYLIDELLSAGASVTAFDPEGMNNVKQLLGDKISFAENQYDALNNADALIIATEWSVFRTPDFEMVTKRLKNKVIFDGRNVYGNEQMKQLGYHYESIGRDIVTQ
jgi:UDPglucose 6-dehydrogenase